MRHRRKGRTLGRNSSHRRALLRNLASSLILTERDDMFYEGMTQADGTTAVNPPRVKGRITTTVHKAKEVRPMVEKCITLAKKAIPHQEAADELESSADRGSDEWKKWRGTDAGQKWIAEVSQAVNLRRRAFAMLRDKEAVSILFEEIAPRFVERPGGYTRIIQLADVRLGDAGKQAILEFVGENDRVKKKTTASKPVVEEDDSEVEEETKADAEEAKADDAAPAAAAAAGAAAAAEDEIKSPKGLGTDDLKVVEGIGPKCEEALKAGGIGSWADLAASTPDKIREILAEAEGNFAAQVPDTWPEQASMAVAGDWEKLEKWQDELDGGKVVE